MRKNNFGIPRNLENNITFTIYIYLETYEGNKKINNLLSYAILVPFPSWVI